MIRVLRSLLGILAAGITTVHAAAPPLEAFARRPALRNMAISPNGSNISYIVSQGDRSIAMVAPREAGDGKPVMSSDPGKFDLSWCSWANDTRLLCGVRGMVFETNHVYPVTRLVGVNADGTNMKVLVQKNDLGSAQLQDQILDWTPDEPDTVLIQQDDDADGFPSVFALNVNGGQMTLRERQQAPIRAFGTDGKGNVRFARGFRDTTEIYYYARLEKETEWRELAKAKAFSGDSALFPIAPAPGVNQAYAIGPHEGRSALWTMDLTDQKPPQLVFSHPLVDASNPMFTADGRLVGIGYELDRPMVHFTDEKLRALMRGISKLRPDSLNYISDYSRDEQQYVVVSYSDVDAGTYLLLDLKTNKVKTLGTQFPSLDPAQLGRMRSISYKAADGTEIPGYLTAPPGVRAEKLPLIVMPHGGPVARDSWEYDMVRAFLVSRGYAVLQMNFRGSSGYGKTWQRSAHQDWGGLTYSDITDGARWAVAQGIADPARMCIVGWSFGGYAALLGAVRNPDLYKCSASIAGVSDLKQLLDEGRYFSGNQFWREQIGTNGDKLRADSPLRHVEEIKMPVLMVHGERDYQVDVEHSRRMAAALKRARKSHRAVFVKDATHQLERESDRTTLLTELEKFLVENLGPGTPGS